MITPVAAAMALSVAGLAALAVQWKTIRGTTLVAAWSWTVFSLLTVTAAELAASREMNESPEWTLHVRYLAAISTFCPMMALLGSKRPQHNAWQFIVLTFLGVLALPAAEALLFYPHEPLALHPARSWFLMILIAVGLFNSLPTRFWPTGLLSGMGQIVLLGRYLPLAELPRSDWTSAAGLACLVLGLILRAAELPPQWGAVSSENKVWLDFRDNYGTLWALRLAERFNDSSRRLDWGVRLTWNGLTTEPNPNSVMPEQSRSANQGLRALLRRFVSSEWLERRRQLG